MPLTKREAAIISAYTGYLIGEFSEMQKYAEEILQMPIWTHQFGNQELANKLSIRAKEDFIKIPIKE